MMWFSAVYADPEMATLPSQLQPRTLYDVLRRARREKFGRDGEDQSWSTSQLIKACSAQGLKVVGRGETKDFWVVGKRSVGLKGFEPLWERTLLPKLKIMEQIKGRSLDELEDLMSGFSRVTYMLWFLRPKDFPWEKDAGMVLRVPEMTKELQKQSVNN